LTGNQTKTELLRILLDLGIRRLDAEVYLYLAISGPKKGRAVSKELKINKQQLYRSLKKLQSKGMVNASPEYPARFSAVLFDKFIDLLIKAKKEQAKTLQASKEELLSSWRSITEKDNEKSYLLQ
jgi:sugar-specific transcriptional regulator TrmB